MNKYASETSLRTHPGAWRHAPSKWCSILLAVTGWVIGCGVFAAPDTPVATLGSPDGKWEYVSDGKPKVVKSGTKEVAVEFDGSDYSQLIWAPDSARFAIRQAGGKGSGTYVYQLRDGQWAPGDDALGNGDALMERAGGMIDAQAKKKGLPKGTFLHMNSWTVESERWIDARTLVLYASMTESVHRRNGEFVGPSYGVSVLFTVKFNEAGEWKIMDAHEMSKKEAEKRGKKE